MPNLVKLYTDAQRCFVHQINNNKNWKKSFASMRSALHQCIKELNLKLAVQQYYALYTVMQEFSPENDLSIAGAVTELVVESGWALFNRASDKEENSIFQSILACISTAVMYYSCINSVYADLLLENKLSSESESYYQAACAMLTDFLEKLYLSEVKHTIDLSPLVNEARKKILKIAALSMEQNKDKEVTVLLSQYEEVSSKYLFDESDEVRIERLGEYDSLQASLKRQIEIKAIKIENKRQKKKIKSFPSVDEIDKSLDLYFLIGSQDLLETQKEGEFNSKILDEISLRQKTILERISLITIISDQTLEVLIAETLLEDSFSIANEITQSVELPEVMSESNTISTSLEDISDISLSVDEAIPSALVNIQHFFDQKPFCAQDRYSEFIDFFSTILEKYNCEAFLFGSAHYKKFPNDLDILLNSNVKITNALIGELVLHQGGNILANYEKTNRRVVRMYFYGMLIDFILSADTILEHSKRLDFSIGALYFDLRRKIMFCPHPHSFQHIQLKQLNTISDAYQMFEHDPSVIFRAVRIMASENFVLSESTCFAIKKIFLVKNVFLKMNPDKLYHEMVQLFFSGHAVRTLEILVKELEIFQYIPKTFRF